LILINGNWEQINSLEDALRVIEEYYNEELADKMNYLISEKNWDLVLKLDDALNEVSSLEDELDYYLGLIDVKNKQIENLEMLANKLKSK